MQPNDEWLELFSDVVHDLKTPISAIRGYIELIQYSGPLNDKQRLYSDRTLVALQHMQRFVSNLLDIAWLDAEKPLELAICNPAILVDEALAVLEGLAAQRNVMIDVNLSATTGVVMADARRLSQVIFNLMSNAVRYNKAGGSVVVTGSGSEDEITLSVTDTGIGIPTEDLPQIFHRFYRASNATHGKIEGSGLGLAIVHGIIQKHQGRVWAESVPGEGSIFTFTLPRVPVVEGVTEVAAEAAAAMGRAKGMVIGGSGEMSDGVDDDLQEADDRLGFDHDDEI